ncbi:hypothetical protein F5144DRAFT_557300 [Chaetomium tenue]|uniref:Uncharacterized protein n=1 Tax=Chaetomium tenue TaxID=1854479 RepID=A0ACB7PTB6_9PEZI|nr:hypothetical protein F5144DRAFT_557300 [Chaetomium globosum]
MMDSTYSVRPSLSPSDFIYAPRRRTQHNLTAGTPSALFGGNQHRHSLPAIIPSAFGPVDWQGREAPEQEPRVPSPRAFADGFEYPSSPEYFPPPAYSPERPSRQQHHGPSGWAQDPLPSPWRQDPLPSPWRQDHNNAVALLHPAPRRASQPAWVSRLLESPPEQATTPASPTTPSTTTHETQATRLSISRNHLLRTTTTTTTTTTATTTTVTITETTTIHPADPLLTNRSGGGAAAGANAFRRPALPPP